MTVFSNICKANSRRKKIGNKNEVVNVQMWHLGTGFSAGLGNAGLMVGFNDPREMILRFVKNTRSLLGLGDCGPAHYFLQFDLNAEIG